MSLCTNESLGDLWDYTLDTFKPERDLECYQSMPRSYQVFYLVFWWNCECQNGGLGHFILSHSGNRYAETIQALMEIDDCRSARWLSLLQDGFGTTFSSDRDERHRQLGACEIADLDRLAEVAAEKTVSELGDWTPDETELKLWVYVERHGLYQMDALVNGPNTPVN